MNPAPARVLLVEDSTSDALLLRESLAEARPGELDFTHVESWVEAVECLRQKPFDVLLLDLSLPDITGRDTFLRARAYDAGANGCLVKPSALTELVSGVMSLRDFWLLHNRLPDTLGVRPTAPLAG